MKLFAKLGLVALLGLMLVPNTAYADDHNDNGNQFEVGSGHDDDDDDGRKKPKFQTKFFAEDDE